MYDGYPFSILATSGIAITGSNNVLVVSIDENGFELDDQVIETPCNLFNTICSTYSFRLGVKDVICIGTLLYEYDESQQVWSKLSCEMPHNRVGAAYLELENNVIVFGGSINGQYTNTIDVINQDFSLCTMAGVMPIPIRFHTITRLSANEFILVGGENSKGNMVQDVYYGQIPLQNRSFVPTYWDVRWAKLKPLNLARSKHCAFFAQNRLIVIGGITDFDRLHRENCGKVVLNPWGPTRGSPLKKKRVGTSIEYLKLTNWSRCAREIAFSRNCDKYIYLPFIIASKGWKYGKVHPLVITNIMIISEFSFRHVVLMLRKDLFYQLL